MLLQDFGRYDFIGHALPHVKGFELAFGDVFAYVDVPRPGLPVRKGDGNRLGRAVSGRGRGMRDDDVGFARYLCVVFGDFGGGLGRGGFVGLVVESVEGTVEGLLGKGLRAFPGQYGCFAFEFGDGADVPVAERASSSRQTARTSVLSSLRIFQSAGRSEGRTCMMAGCWPLPVVLLS